MKKWLEPNPYVNTAIQLSLPIGLYLGISSDASIIWWILATFMFLVVYALVANNIVLHRYYTHKHFEVSKPVEWLFAYLSVASGLGSPASYAAVHLTHHYYSDTDLDPHGPKAGVKSLLFFFHNKEGLKTAPIYSKTLLKLVSRYRRLHEMYVPLMILNAIILATIDWKLFLFAWLIPASLGQWGVAIGVYLQHIGGKINNFYYSLIGLGDELHIHHHNDPSLVNHAIKPGQVDFTYQMSRLFATKFNYRK